MGHFHRALVFQGGGALGAYEAGTYQQVYRKIGAKNVVPVFLENELPKRGAIYEKAYVHEPLVVVSGDNGRLITGQNPESAMNVGEKVVEKLTSP